LQIVVQLVIQPKIQQPSYTFPIDRMNDYECLLLEIKEAVNEEKTK